MMIALTGCDSKSKLNGIGKKGRVTTFRKHKDDLVGLKNLDTDCTVISNGTLTVCFKFIGLLYGEATSSFNHLRYNIFSNKHLESSKLPTEDSALYYVKRANYQCFIWKHARDRRLSLTLPDGNRWTKDEMVHLIPKLMEKDSVPESLLELIVCRFKKRCNARCSCRRVRLSCTATSFGENECSNLQENDEDEEL